MDTFKSNKIKFGMNEMRMNKSEKSLAEMKQSSLANGPTLYRYQSWDSLGEYIQRRKTVNERGFSLLRKERLKDQREVSLM